MDGSGDLYLMDEDGGNLKNISNGIGHCINPSFSSDGNMITFECWEDGVDLYLYDITTDSLYLILDGNSGSRYAIFIDNDQRILFSYHEISPCLYSIKLDGSERKLFIDVPDTYETFLKTNSDGSIITFTGIDAPDENIYTINSDGSELKKLTYSEERERKSFFSSSNSSIIYQVLFLHNYEVYAMNIDGSNQRNLTNSKYNESYPDLSDDGNYLVYTSTRNTIWDIYLINLSTGEEINITNSEQVERDPKFVCNDNKIVYESDYQIYILDLESNEAKNLTNNQYYNSEPVIYP
jgi:TolB protein